MELEKIAVFDIETTAIEKGSFPKHIHCMWIDDGEGYLDYTFETMSTGVAYLASLVQRGFTLVGHNIMAFDLQVLQQQYPYLIDAYQLAQSGQVFDTYLVGSVICHDMANEDWAHIRADPDYMPRRLAGSHSLKAWGKRVGEFKDDYEGGWEHWNEEMHAYNKQDVIANRAVFDDQLRRCKEIANALDITVEEFLSKPWFALEHKVATIMAQADVIGMGFDVDGAHTLVAELQQELDSLHNSVGDPAPWPKETVMKKPQGYKAYHPNLPGVCLAEQATKTACAYEAKKAVKEFNLGASNQQVLRIKDISYIEGPPAVKKEHFNPTSRYHVAEYLMTYCGYEVDGENATKNTFKDGSPVPRVDDSILALYDGDKRVKAIARIFLLNKRIGQLEKGQTSWLRMHRKGIMHSRHNTVGTNSGRGAHSGPNIGQVPASRSPYGNAMRRLFGPVWRDARQVGVDQSGIELRNLAHYLYPYDKGAYAHIVLEGDVHKHNQHLMGLDDRDKAKTAIYAMIYGAGPATLGAVKGGGFQTGLAMRKQIMDGLTGYSALLAGIKRVLTERGFLLGIDGRPLRARKEHSALNLLLQNCGAVLSKQWIVTLFEETPGWGKDWSILCWVHDEIQVQTRKDPEAMQKQMQWAAAEAGKVHQFRLPVDTEGSTGANWAETH